MPLLVIPCRPDYEQLWRTSGTEKSEIGGHEQEDEVDQFELRVE